MTRDATQRFDAADVLAHLFYAVSTAGRVTVTTVFGDASGRLQYPDGEGVKIATDEAVTEMAPGTPLCVEYADSGSTFRFYTEVASTGDREIVAVLPYGIECSDRRLTQRFELAPDAGFLLHTRDEDPAWETPLADISAGGMSFPDPTGGLRIGQHVGCALHIPDEPVIPCTIEVRSVALRRGLPRVGARIAEISIRDRGRLARRLAAGATPPAEPDPGVP